MFCEVIVEIVQALLGWLPEGSSLATVVEGIGEFLLNLFNCVL